MVRYVSPSPLLPLSLSPSPLSLSPSPSLPLPLPLSLSPSPSPPLPLSLSLSPLSPSPSLPLPLPLSLSVRWGKRAAHNRAQIVYYIAENLELRHKEVAQRISDMTGYITLPLYIPPLEDTSLTIVQYCITTHSFTVSVRCTRWGGCGLPLQGGHLLTVNGR